MVSVIVLSTLMAALTLKFVVAQMTFPAIFDFDNGTPTLVESQGTPLSQVSNGVTAYFNSTSDPAGFSVQSYGTTFFQLSQFSGKYLYDNKQSRDTLEISFNASVTSINFTFATIEFHGGPGVDPTNITLTAYAGSTNSTPIGLAVARGTWPSGDTYPQGTLTFNSPNQQFNIVRIELPYQGASAAVDFLIDRVAVTTTGEPIPELPNATILALLMLIMAPAVIAARKLARNPLME